MTFRSRRLLDLAHGMPCQAKFPHNCVQWEGVEPAHSDSSVFGRGHGHKSADWAFAAVCHHAHLAFNDMAREIKFMEWLRAYVATQNYLWENGLIEIS